MQTLDSMGMMLAGNSAIAVTFSTLSFPFPDFMDENEYGYSELALGNRNENCMFALLKRKCWITCFLSFLLSLCSYLICLHSIYKYGVAKKVKILIRFLISLRGV